LSGCFITWYKKDTAVRCAACDVHSAQSCSDDVFIWIGIKAHQDYYSAAEADTVGMDTSCRCSVAAYCRTASAWFRELTCPRLCNGFAASVCTSLANHTYAGGQLWTALPSVCYIRFIRSPSCENTRGTMSATARGRERPASRCQTRRQTPQDRAGQARRSHLPCEPIDVLIRLPLGRASEPWPLPFQSGASDRISFRDAGGVHGSAKESAPSRRRENIIGRAAEAIPYSGTRSEAGTSPPCFCTVASSSPSEVFDSVRVAASEGFIARPCRRLAVCFLNSPPSPTSIPSVVERPLRPSIRFPWNFPACPPFPKRVRIPLPGSTAHALEDTKPIFSPCLLTPVLYVSQCWRDESIYV
jgi:hypothetical protein